MSFVPSCPYAFDWLILLPGTIHFICVFVYRDAFYFPFLHVLVILGVSYSTCSYLSLPFRLFINVHLHVHLFTAMYFLSLL